MKTSNSYNSKENDIMKYYLLIFYIRDDKFSNQRLYL